MIRNQDGTLDVEILVAYADDALAEPDRSRIVAALASDAEAERTVEALRKSAALAAHAFDDVLTAPVPDRLIAAATGRRTAAAPDRIAPPIVARNDNRRRIAAAAVLALLMLAAGYVGGLWTAGREPDLQPAGVGGDGIDDPAALGALYTLLNDTPETGQTVAYDDGAALLDAPLALVDGVICWQFTLAPADAATLHGIACPAAAGGWTLMSRDALP